MIIGSPWLRTILEDYQKLSIVNVSQITLSILIVLVDSILKSGIATKPPREYRGDTKKPHPIKDEVFVSCYRLRFSFHFL